MFGLVKCVVLVSAALAASGRQLEDSDVVFHLYTENNPVQSQPLTANVNSIMVSFFSMANPTVITIHNHGETVGGNFNAFVVPAHLSARSAVNVISVDWSPGSSLYLEGLANSAQCGRIIANFVNILVNTFGYPVANIRIVGVGLGGHIAGIAATHVNGIIPHVIALDPSLHGWTHHPERLSPAAAGVVEVIHTTAGVRGYDDPLGHFDFYPNGGTHQAGCSIDIDCSHIYAYAFYAESITAEVNSGARFVGTRCATYEQAITMSCTGERDATFGGLQSKTSVSGGIFTFLTNPTPPFANN